MKNLAPLFVVALVLLLGALSSVQAVDPPPDGGYPNENTAEGEDALFSLTTGFNNTAIGFNALYNNTEGFYNTAIGGSALYSNTTGNRNMANGAFALYANTEGIRNTAVGNAALPNNTTGEENTATGNGALLNNTTASRNTATGANALFNNTTASANTATGSNALFNNTTGFNNTANGVNALYNNTIGFGNTANGRNTLLANIDGQHNTANGNASLRDNSSGSFNTAVGEQALRSNVVGSFNIALGYQAGNNILGDNNIDIGNVGVVGESGTMRIGTAGTHTNAYVAGIYGTTVAKSIPVFIDSTGQLGTKGSSERLKTRIKPMDKASEAILALKPVTFHYKQELDPERTNQFGLIAEQVEKVNPDLVARDADGKVYTVRYDAVNAMLLNEFLKQHRQVQEQQKQIAKLTAQLKEQAAQIRKVNDKVEMSRSAPRTASTKQ